MTRSHWLIAATSLAAGLVLGAGAMLVAYPFLFPPPALAEARPQALAATMPAPPGNAAVAASESAAVAFHFDPDAPGRDPIHWADGSGEFIPTAEGWVLRLNADFRSGPGPNFWIYLNTVPVGEERAFLADAGRLRLAPLRAFEGAQNYLLPAGVTPADFRTVTVWCESFDAYIGSAALPLPPSDTP